MFEQRPWVVKLGGSLQGAGTLGTWLRAMSASKGAVVLVPGGGPFSDAVRAAQERHGFDDRTAHRMAILAMQQYGTLLAALDGELETAGSLLLLQATRRRGRTPVWLPDLAMLDAAGVANSWTVTSDSLAAWLARGLGAAGLILVKSAPAPPGGPLEWAQAGFVDAAFPDYATTYGGPVQACCCDDDPWTVTKGLALAA